MAAGVTGAWLVARVPGTGLQLSGGSLQPAASASFLHPRERGQHILLAARVCWCRPLLAALRWCFGVGWDRGRGGKPRH